MSTKNLARRIVIAAALGATLVVPATASADSFGAGDAAERRLVSMGYAKYDPFVYCSRDGYRHYWCNVHGDYGDCFLGGHVAIRQYSAYRYRMTFHGVGRRCY